MRLFEKRAVWESRQPPARLIHIGPHKTGTTTVQSAFHDNRPALVANGVHYLGPDLQPTKPVKAITGSIKDAAERVEALAAWEALMAEAQGADARTVVLSSEFLCESDDQAAARVVTDLGGESARVVVTLRPLAKILPSQWQQFVQAGNRQTFQEWIEEKLDRNEKGEVDLFWKRHRHDRLVERWAATAGKENVTVVIADSRDPDQLPRVFTRLAGLPDGVLVPKHTVANRSLTWEEAEAIRHFNIQHQVLNKHRTEKGEPPVPLSMDQRMAAWRHVKRRTPLPGEQKIVLPVGTVDRVDAVAKDMVATILGTGVEIIGEPKSLSKAPKHKELEQHSQPRRVPSQVAARVATALLIQATKS